jgi:phospholipase/lecithinase/hemolysin
VKTLRISLAFLSLSLAALAVPDPAAAQKIPKFDAFYVFSDSLGDTGNDWILTFFAGANPAIPPSVSPHRTYFFGRFSNGPILFEYLWSRVNSDGGPVLPSLAFGALPPKGAISFAFGGSKSGNDCTLFRGLQCQVDDFAGLLRGNPPPTKALYAVFSGANDVLNANPPPQSEAEVAVLIGGIVTNISTSVQRLYALGARDVMVVNMPNLGLAPLVTDPVLKVQLDFLAQQHNVALEGALDALSNSPLLPGLRIIRIDAYGFLKSLTSKSSFNFAVPALPFPAALCLFDGNPLPGPNCPNANFNVAPSFFFWDVEHPTTTGHAAFAAFVYRELKAFYR